MHLPEACNAGLGLEQSPAMPDVICLNFIRDWRSRPNEGHLSPEHVPELWELIETGAPHESTDPGDSRIARNLINDFLIFYCSARLSLPGNEIPDIRFMDSCIS